MKYMIEILKDAGKIALAMVWLFIGLAICASPFMLGGIGPNANVQLENTIAISLMCFSPFWLSISKKLIDLNLKP